VTWDDWIERHATAFGFGLYERSAAREAAMLASWAAMFESEGYFPSDLAAATRVMEARPSSPEYREGHRAALLEILRSERARQLEARNEQARRGGGDLTAPPCRDCGGAGWVGVPYPPESKQGREGVRGGYLPTCAVACSCRAGQPCREPYKGRRMMTLEEYECYVPHWRELLANQRDIEAASAKAHKDATDMDREFGGMVAKHGGRE
jgi:hypothetical protein